VEPRIFKSQGMGRWWVSVDPKTLMAVPREALQKRARLRLLIRRAAVPDLKADSQDRLAPPLIRRTTESIRPLFLLKEDRFTRNSRRSILQEKFFFASDFYYGHFGGN